MNWQVGNPSLRGSGGRATRYASPTHTPYPSYNPHASPAYPYRESLAAGAVQPSFVCASAPQRGAPARRSGGGGGGGGGGGARRARGPSAGSECRVVRPQSVGEIFGHKVPRARLSPFTMESPGYVRRSERSVMDGLRVLPPSGRQGAEPWRTKDLSKSLTPTWVTTFSTL